jgi:hypothetical protein
MKNKMVNGLVRYYVELEKASWSSLLAKHGYTDVEEDLTSDGQWHDEIRDLGRVAFWKQKGLDGIIVRHVKFYDWGGCTAHGTGVNAVGEAKNYFERLGYSCQIEERKSPIRKKLENMGILKKKPNQYIEEKVKVNGREFDSINLRDSVKFYDFLTGEQK